MRARSLVLSALILGASGCAHGHAAPAPMAGEYAVYFLPARGDSIVIDSGDTEIVIDGGRDPEPLKALLKRVVHDETIELVIVTHVDLDHWEGFSEGALDGYTVAELWDPGYEAMPTRFLDEEGYEQVLDRLANGRAKRWRPLKDGDLPTEPRRFGDVSVEFLHPKRAPTTQRKGRKKRISGPNAYLNNNTSIVVRVEVDGQTFLLTGDINGTPKKGSAEKAQEVEGELVRTYPDLHADVLKVPHHGSPTSSTVEFIKAVSPKYSVVPHRHLITKPRVVRRHRHQLCDESSPRECENVLLTNRRTVRCTGRGDQFACGSLDD